PVDELAMTINATRSFTSKWWAAIATVSPPRRRRQRVGGSILVDVGLDRPDSRHRRLARRKSSVKPMTARHEVDSSRRPGTSARRNGALELPSSRSRRRPWPASLASRICGGKRVDPLLGFLPDHGVFRYAPS